jgi:O-antigen/teichoic acid export membrane protein
VVSALLLLLLAYFSTPGIVGVYNWGIIFYTLFQALTDSPLRQILIIVSSSRKGLRFLRKYRIYAASMGVVTLSTAFFLLYQNVDSSVRSQVWALLPLALAPIFTATGVAGLGRIQANHGWHVLAAGQSIAAIASLVVAFPVLFLTHSPIGCTVGLLTTEAVFAIWCIRRSREFSTPLISTVRERVGSMYVHMAGYSGLAWLQGQADRVLIGSFSGASNLGYFSMASALARSLGDALASSSANLLRSEIGTLHQPTTKQVRIAATRSLNKGIWLATSASVASIAATEFVVRPLLGPEWETALSIVPVIALCTVPSLLSWSSAVLHLANKSSSRALIAPAVGVVFALPIALVAASDLQAAAWIVVVRELTLCTLAYGLIGKMAPWGSLRIGIATVLGLAGLMILLGLAHL